MEKDLIIWQNIRNQGRQYELERLEDLRKLATDVEEQITIDVETWMVKLFVLELMLGYDKETGQLLIQEHKSLRLLQTKKKHFN